MKKWDLAAMALAVGLALGGCGGAGEAPPAGTATAASGAGGQPAPSSEQGTAFAEAAPTDGEALGQALGGILNYEAGTAGSSLKVATAAAQLLNYTQTYEPGQAAAAGEAISQYLQGLGEEEVRRFTDNLAAVNRSARQIAQGGQEAAGLLESAGNPQKFDSYDLQKYEAVYGLITLGLSALGD